MKRLLLFRNSNTSHVLIYQRAKYSFHAVPEFKYISCSYLSQYHWFYAFICKNSNTSHVLIYQTKCCSRNCGVTYSNTSHVLIYQLRDMYVFPSFFKFKYISCSYLSGKRHRAGVQYQIQIHLMFLFINSFIPTVPLHPLFKYISCSYLSYTVAYRCVCSYNSNTSHVLIYLEQIRPHLPTLLHSNTSHVLIYLQVVGKRSIDVGIQIHLMFLFIKHNHHIYKRTGYIQIHLMFLFIAKPNNIPKVPTTFKYISYSYLSLCIVQCTSFYQIQIHLMFLFIQNIYLKKTQRILIQIHLMFLFIFCIDISITPSFADSNTSHVLIYRMEFKRIFDIFRIFKYISCSYLSNVFPPFLISII